MDGEENGMAPPAVEGGSLKWQKAHELLGAILLMVVEGKSQVLLSPPLLLAVP
jgi:hypothetical protein